MIRIEGICCGDCARCALLADGKVDMVPCAIDQILRRVQRMEKEMEEIKKAMNGREKVEIALSSIEQEESEEV